MNTQVTVASVGSQVFAQLLDACLSRQLGAVNVRRIMSPLFDGENDDQDAADFWAAYDACKETDPEQCARVDWGVDIVNILLPERPVVTTPEPETEPETPPEVPTIGDPTAPDPLAPHAETQPQS